MKQTLKEMYDYLMKNAEVLEVDPDLTFEQFVTDTIDAYDCETSNGDSQFKSFDEFVKYESEQVYYW